LLKARRFIVEVFKAIAQLLYCQHVWQVSTVCIKLPPPSMTVTGVPDRKRGDTVSVYVRVRPLTRGEISKNADNLPGLRLSSTEPEEQSSANVFEANGVRIGGFSGLLGQEALNVDVYDRCFARKLQTVVRGGSVSLFCYGYTGSGKTHTVIGYGEERGLYYLAAEGLLRELAVLEADRLDREEDDSLFLQATACEMYNDEVFDLLGKEKVPCTLRVDERGQLQILGPQTSSSLDQSESGVLEELLTSELLTPEQQRHLHATLITRSADLRAASVFRPEDLQEISRTCVLKRAVGSSTEHAQSSRSHALLRLEVVNLAVLKARRALSEAKAMMAPRKSALDNVMTCRFVLLSDGFQTILAPVSASPADVDRRTPLNEIPEGSYEVVSNEPAGKICSLRGHEEMGFKSYADWAVFFSCPPLEVRHVIKKRKYEEPGKWEAIRDALEAKAAVLQRKANEAEVAIQEASTALEKATNRGPAALGGSMTLVDLAGADYDHRSGSQQKESAAINKSLLSLKECLRSLANIKGAKPKFRDSKLTRLLEDSLSPGESSSRRNQESVSVMMVNLSPAGNLERMTLNTLRYGQMFASTTGQSPATKGKGPAPVAKESTGAKAKGLAPDGMVSAAADGRVPAPARMGSARANGKIPAPVANESAGAKIREELMSLYREHCPDKSEQEVQTIIHRFAGRETELLQKAREKYDGAAK